ncbi:hypothetical protein F1880_000968 [Penicillium rolfsii]|nr:hypothetical protein F1880_000968 [Penicillium rolfsii]
MFIVARIRFVMLLLAIFMVGGGFTLNVDIFEETLDVVAHNAAGVDRPFGMVANAFVLAARAVTEVTGASLTLSDGKPAETSKVSSTIVGVTRVTATMEPISTSVISSTPIRVTLTVPTGASEGSTTTTETETETEPCEGGETSWTFTIVPTSTIPAWSPATKTETETETETVNCSHTTPCHISHTSHTLQISSTGFGITISLTSLTSAAVTGTGTSSGTKVTTSSKVAVTSGIAVTPGVVVTSGFAHTSGGTLVTKSSGTGTKTAIESTPLVSGTSTARTATATTVFNGTKKLKSFNKLTATILLLVCKLVL